MSESTALPMVAEGMAAMLRDPATAGSGQAEGAKASGFAAFLAGAHLRHFGLTAQQHSHLPARAGGLDPGELEPTVPALAPQPGGKALPPVIALGRNLPLEGTAEGLPVDAPTLRVAASEMRLTPDAELILHHPADDAVAAAPGDSVIEDTENASARPGEAAVEEPAAVDVQELSAELPPERAITRWPLQVLTPGPHAEDVPREPGVVNRTASSVPAAVTPPPEPTTGGGDPPETPINGEVSLRVFTTGTGGGEAGTHGTSTGGGARDPAVPPPMVQAAATDHASSDSNTGRIPLPGPNGSTPPETSAPAPGSATGPSSEPSFARALSLEQSITSPRWGEALASRVVWLVNQNGQQAEVRVNPPHLGPLEIRVALGSDQASVNFTVHSAAVREAVEAALPRLRETFAEAGLGLGDVIVAERDNRGHADSSNREWREARGPALPQGDRGEVPQASSAYAPPMVVQGLLDFYI